MYETILGSKIDHISVGQPTSDINKTQNLIEVLKGIRRECTSLQIGEHTRRKLTIAFHYALKSKSGIDEVLERFNEIILEAETISKNILKLFVKDEHGENGNYIGFPKREADSI